MKRDNIRKFTRKIKTCFKKSFNVKTISSCKSKTNHLQHQLDHFINEPHSFPFLFFPQSRLDTDEFSFCGVEIEIVPIRQSGLIPFGGAHSDGHRNSIDPFFRAERMLKRPPGSLSPSPEHLHFRRALIQKV